MSPRRERPPAVGPGADQNGGVEAQRSGCMVAPLSDTERYLLGRERILGDRLNLAYEPEQAARELIELTGDKTLAWRWLSAVMKQVDR
jgi:hypothetical protein